MRQTGSAPRGGPSLQWTEHSREAVSPFRPLSLRPCSSPPANSPPRVGTDGLIAQDGRVRSPSFFVRQPGAERWHPTRRRRGVPRLPAITSPPSRIFLACDVVSDGHTEPRTASRGPLVPQGRQARPARRPSPSRLSRAHPMRPTRVVTGFYASIPSARVGDEASRCRFLSFGHLVSERPVSTASTVRRLPHVEVGTPFRLLSVASGRRHLRFSAPALSTSPRGPSVPLRRRPPLAPLIASPKTRSFFLSQESQSFTDG